MSLTTISRFILHSFIYQPRPNNSVRLYGRWIHRKPTKVLLPFEPNSKSSLKKEKVINLAQSPIQENQNENQSSLQTVKQNNTESKPFFTSKKVTQMKKKRNEDLKKRKFYLSQHKVFDDNNEIIFEKCKDNDGRVSTLLTNLKSKKDRIRTEQILVEGWRMIVDGLEAQCNLRYVIFSRTEALKNLRPFLPKTGVKFFKIPYKEISLWSDVETSPGIFGIFEMPSETNIQRLSKPLPLSLICDNIRVPGNLGAILRVAVGAGCDKVLLTKGCVDVWDPKVVRSGAGAHFRLPIKNSVNLKDMPEYLEEHTTVCIADSNAKIDDISEKNYSFNDSQIPVLPYYGVLFSLLDHVTVVIGGETEGISEDSYKLAEQNNGMKLNIPMARGVDSLNTGMATAVILFEIRKQLIQAKTRIKPEKQAAVVT